MSRRQKVYPIDVTMIFPTEKARKPRKHHIPDMSPVSAETMLVGVKWQKISWRGGTKGPLTCLFAARRVRIADGPKHRVFDKGVERMPGDEVWILAERRSSGEQKYYISNLPADVPLKTLAAAVKARWICEQAHRRRSSGRLCHRRANTSPHFSSKRIKSRIFLRTADIYRYSGLPVRHFSVGSISGRCHDKLETGFGSDQEGRLKEL
jgi:hypothetical protein